MNQISEKFFYNPESVFTGPPGGAFPEGFSGTGFSGGIKNSGPDMTLLLSGRPSAAAGVYTKNRVQAHCVQWNRAITESGNSVRAILVNSGNANACTGEQGKKDLLSIIRCTSETLSIRENGILNASTGVIGAPLPVENMVNGIKNNAGTAGNTNEDWIKACEGILTTDRVIKTGTVTVTLGGKNITLSGMAKGSGMIHPNMATMLAFILTDASVSPRMLQKALIETVEDTYNMISVDGDTSTNDMALILANGAAGNQEIDSFGDDYLAFKQGLHELNRHLAVSIVRDGEGATKFLEVSLSGADSRENARKLVKSVISSSLVKTAFFGCDANWGRILAAMGYSGADFNPEQVDIEFETAAGKILLMEKGSPVPFEESTAKKILSGKDIRIHITLYEGKEEALAWGCDLSYDYVKINGDYRS